MIPRMAERPPEHRRRTWPAALVALVVLGAPLTSCSDDDGGVGGGAETAEGGGGATGTLQLTPSSTTTTAPGEAAVYDLLLAEPPLDGFARADDVLGTGALDLEAAAAAERDVDAERALLEARGFERGASRAWLDPDQDVVYLAVYDFGDAEGATAYLQAAAEGLQARGATAFDVPEVPGALGFTTVEDGPDGTFSAHAVTFARGDRWFLALVGSPGRGRSPEDVRAVAAAQSARLG